MSVLAQQIVLGLLIGGLYGLAAAGLSLVFGVMKVLDVAHGELIMLGGYAAFFAVALLGLDPFGSLAVVIPVSLLFGAVLYLGLFAFVVRADEETRVKNSLLIGGLYGLAAAGLSLVFGVLKVLNVAHGELIMLGGYGVVFVVALLGLDPFAALLIVIPLSLLLGAVLYGGLFGFVVRADEETRVKNSLLIGFGLALAFHALAVRLWTADERSIVTPYGGSVFMVGDLAIPLVRLLSLILAFLLIGGLHLLLARWRWGKAIRATAEDWQAALLTGIDVRRAYLLAFALGTALAGAAGTLVSIAYSVSPAIGLEWTLKALIVVVLAGLGSMLGTFVGGLVLGVAEAASAAAFGGAYREIVGLVIFVLVLVARPKGLFGR